MLNDPDPGPSSDSLLGALPKKYSDKLPVEPWGLKRGKHKIPAALQALIHFSLKCLRHLGSGRGLVLRSQWAAFLSLVLLLGDTMRRAFKIFVCILVLSATATASDVWAKERIIALKVSKVSGIGAECPMPSSFSVSYKNLSKSRIQFLKKISRQKHGVATFTKMSQDGNVGRVIRTTIKSRKVTVDELAFIIQGGGSCRFTFKNL